MNGEILHKNGIFVKKEKDWESYKQQRNIVINIIRTNKHIYIFQKYIKEQKCIDYRYTSLKNIRSYLTL